MASHPSRLDPAKSRESLASEMLAAPGVSPAKIGRHQEQQRRTLLSQDSRAFTAPHIHQTSSLPFPLNLPPSYPIYPSSSPPTASARPQRPPPLRQSASIPASHLSTRTSDAIEGHSRARSAMSASSSKGKGKGTLDAFMDSRQGMVVNEPESSGSDSELPMHKILALPPSDDYSFSDSSALPSSSPPSSSPLRTPKESSPLRPMYGYSSSPTPKRPSQPTSNLPFVLPPGPYSLEKPPWSLSALIGQALNASRTGSLALSDIYSYVSTVYPHYDRSEQSWMSSVRHNLSLHETFERTPDDDEESKPKKGKRKTKGKGGTWRITPGCEECFIGGNFIKKGAKGAGPGLNHARKRPRDDEREGSDKRSKAESRPGSTTPLASTSTRPQTRPRQCSPARTIYSTRRLSSPPSLTTSQSTLPSDVSFSDPTDLPPSSPIPFEHFNNAMAVSPGSPELPLALIAARRNATKGRSLSFASSLEPGFELTRISGLQNPHPTVLVTPEEESVNRDLFTRVLASTSTARVSSGSRPPSSPNPARLLFPPPPLPSSSASSSNLRTVTPPPHLGGVSATFSPTRTPMSHRGVHMSPSRSLAHYKSSLEPEWRAAAVSSDPDGRRTPPPRDPRELVDEMISTPRKRVFPPGPPQASPFRTPARSATSQRHQRGYDPYDPNMLLADELAGIRKAQEPQESPGGFFGKEGRRLLYESPGVPSHWRYKDEF